MHQEPQEVLVCRFDLRKCLEIHGALADQGVQETLHVLGGLAERFLEGLSLPSDLSLLENLEVQENPHYRFLGVPVLLEVL